MSIEEFLGHLVHKQFLLENNEKPSRFVITQLEDTC